MVILVVSPKMIALLLAPVLMADACSVGTRVQAPYVAITIPAISATNPTFATVQDNAYRK
jgi:hypothetical protein